MIVTPEMIEALATLREFREKSRLYVVLSPVEQRVVRAIGVLEDAEFFNPIDHAEAKEN